MPVNREAAERAISDFLKALGFDPHEHADLAETPERVTEAFTQDLLRGHSVDVRELIRNGSCDATGPVKAGLVAIKEIAIASTCPHHLLPALGVAHVVYLPGAALLGIGTITALVDAFARRLTLQEAIAQNVVSALIEHAGARGAYCELELEHGCLRARGERQAAAIVRSSARAGELASREAISEIALALGRAEGAK
ncbi:MAG TPA: GTP cyclohydrolase I [Polyangiaceae bacterium]|jgi:GTP cyclohydrolase I|nr:GTP cyclohydrolase I [Polyangiaceae bacterium]